MVFHLRLRLFENSELRCARPGAPLKSGEVVDGDVTKSPALIQLLIPFQKSFWEVSGTLFIKRVPELFMNPLFSDDLIR